MPTNPQPARPDLVPFGYATGNYMMRCRSCREHVDGCDKRAWHCLSCAEKRKAEQPAMTNPQPAPAGVQTVWAVVRPDGGRLWWGESKPGWRLEEGYRLIEMALLPLDDPRLAEWQMMDSAPKDGTRILLLLPDHPTKPNVQIGNWFVPYTDRPPYWAMEGCYSTHDDLARQPTAWRHLPPPPATQGSTPQCLIA